MKPCQTQGHGFSSRLLTDEEFSQCREPWNSLLDASRSESFFLKWEWIYTFWETIDKEDAELQVWLCHDGQELVGIAPLYVYSTTFMKVPVRKVAFLGDRVASDCMDIFTAPGYEEICCREVMRGMRYQCPVAYDVLELEGLCADSNLYRYLVTADDAGKGTYLLPIFGCPRAILNTTFDNYTRKLSASTRYLLSRKKRKLERKYGEIAIEHLDLKNNIRMLDVLFDLHRKRWSVLKGKTSTFANAYREVFNNMLLLRLADGAGYFSCISVDKKPVSILYILTYKNNAFFYQNGWDPVFASYSIGMINLHEAIHHAIESGCKSFDFLRGDEKYKYKFCDGARQAYAFLCFGKDISGRTLKNLFLAKQKVKKMLSMRQTAGNRIE